MKRIRLFGLVALVVIVAVVIASTVGNGDDELSACEQHFSDAAEIPASEDAVDDLDPALTSCGSVGEWADAAEKFPAALDGADALTFLRNRCQFGPADAPPCSLVE